MQKKNRKNTHAMRGQVLTEYVIMLILLVLVALGVLSFSYYFSLYGERMVDSVSIEYP